MEFIKGEINRLIGRKEKREIVAEWDRKIKKNA